MAKLMQLSAAQILRFAWKGDVLRSRRVRLENVFVESTNRYKFETVTKEEDGTYSVHNCWVYSVDPTYSGKLFNCKAIKTSCNCERYKFTFEASQSLRNASDIIYSDGELPYVRNPKMKISVCKRLIVALKYIIVKQL